VENIVFWIAQGIGLIALGFSFRAYQSKTREEILSIQMSGSFVYMAHFALLSAWIGVVMNALVAVRNWIFVRKETHAFARHEGWMWFFMALAGLSLLFTWEGFISVLPVLGVILGVYSRWHAKDAFTIRIYSAIGCILWLPYDLVVRSYTGAITDVLTLAVILYAMWKHDRVTLKETVTSV
jgi:hypothetical protein